MKNKITYFETISSTNDYLKENGKSHGEVVISNEQTKGKGRLGREWKSNKDEGLYMSILLRPEIDIENIPFITIIAGSSILKALKNLDIDAKVKWPNDIIINNKKIGGILSELKVTKEDKINNKKQIKNVIVGIGINLKQKHFDEELREKATSIENEGYKISKEDLVVNILEEFEILYNEYIDDNKAQTNKNNTLKIHRENSAIIGKNIYIINKDNKELVKCIDINENGNLIIKKQNGETKEISSGEISIRGEFGYI